MNVFQLSGLLPASSPLLVLCYCLLSRESGLIVQSLFMMACAKINLGGQCTKSVQFRLTNAQSYSSLSRALSRQTELVDVAQGTRCAFSRHWVSNPVGVESIP